MVKLVKKRDGSVVDFKRAKVLQAISNALKATQVDAAKAANITEKVISIIDVVYKKMTP
ncbi:hypothetical protein HN511_05530, partial [bacterium]|nr:hypothetical protein [bacterium]